MRDAPESFRFFQIPSVQAPLAFGFHKEVSANNEHIWPRTEDEIQKYSEEGELFGIIKSSSGEFVGLCYAHYSEEERAWEIGGLTVIPELRQLGLGSFIVRYALGRTIAAQDPWKYGDRIIAHVHSDNQSPRNLLTTIKFVHRGKVNVPADKAPASMKRNPDGTITGDLFEFELGSVPSLSEWFDKEFNGLLLDGKAKAEFDCGELGLDSLMHDLRTLAKEVREK
jgi:GNAT superfamily N-acetyltransferase